MMRKFLRSFLLLVFLAGTTLSLRGQSQNRQEYYGDPIHFGFFLGVNSTNFMITPVHSLPDSVKTILSSKHTGFNLGIVSELRLHEYVTLRFVPDIAFGSRSIEYHVEGVDTVDYVKKVESTFLDFPLDIKVRSKRLNNFAAYMVAGGKYTLDLASQKDVNNASATNAQKVVKLAKNDWCYEAGAGCDFFLPYFKFGIELKLSLGLRNLLVKDPAGGIFTNSIDSLRSKMFLVSFTFEG